MMREICEHHKGKERLSAKDGGELVEEGEWINKSVLSASLGPAQRFKWVDVGSSISTFFSLLFSSLLFLLLSFFAFHMADSTSSPPLPLPLPRHALPKWPVSSTWMLARAHPASPERRLISGSIVSDHPAGWTPFSSSPSPAQMFV